MCVERANFNFSTENAQFKGKRLIVTPLRFAYVMLTLKMKIRKIGLD